MDKTCTSISPDSEAHILGFFVLHENVEAIVADTAAIVNLDFVAAPNHDDQHSFVLEQLQFFLWKVCVSF